MKALFISIATAIAGLVVGVVVLAPTPVSAEARACASRRGELLPGAAACLVDLDLALRPEGYVFRFENGAADSEVYRDIVATVAGELSVITSLPFSIGPDIDADLAPRVGEIIVRLHRNTEQCNGSSACAAGEYFGSWPWTEAMAGDEIQGGQIYLTTNIDGDSLPVRKAAVMHEVGHVLGLQHYDYLPDIQPSREIMAWNVRVTSVVEWQPGDIAGLEHLANYQRRSPTGTLSNVDATANGFIVNGMMSDPSSAANQSILVTVDDHEAQPGTMGGRFAATVGAHRVCVGLANTGAGSDTSLGCQDIVVSADPNWWLLVPLGLASS